MLTTGIPNFDTVLGGGVRTGDILLLIGGAGTGKTTVCLQTAFHTARQGNHVTFVTTFSESPEKMLRHADSFSFYDEDLIDQRIHLRNLYPLVEQDLDDLRDAIVDAVEEHDATLLVFDGLASVRDLQSDDFKIRRFIHDLGGTLGTLDCATMIATSFYGREGEHLPELTMADGVVRLGLETLGDRTVRTLQVQKMRGRSPLLGRHSLGIGDDGVIVFPRVESMTEAGDAGLSEQRKSLGLDVLDGMMDGGPPERSLTMVAGAPATGKTLVGLGFIAEGVEQGEKGVIVTFRETPRQLEDKAAAFGLDLREAVEDGQVKILHRPPVDLNVDETALEIRREIEELGAQRLLIDTIDDLEGGILNDRRRRGYMASLAGLLRRLEVTSVATLQVPQVAGPELDVGDSPIAVLAENLVMLRNVEYDGRLLRVLSVVKMRDSAYDSEVRQYQVTESGLEVLEPDDTETGLLQGISSLPSEARVKREAPPEDES